MTDLISLNPVTGQQVWKGPISSADDINACVGKSVLAQKKWARLSFDARAEVVKQFSALVAENADDLARLISAETGKALWDAKAEVGATIAKAAISLKSYAERTGAHTLLDNSLRLNHRPHGVMAVVGPFNFPAHLPNGHITPAFLAGNTVVFKPSEQTPAVAEMMWSLWQQAGLPENVLQVVHGSVEAGQTLVAHAEVNGVLFTGGVTAGAAIHRALAGQPHKMLALELGGNNPIVAWGLDDDSVDAAASQIVFSAFVSAGQRCTCARRLIVGKGAMGDAVIERVLALTQRLRVGAPLEDEQPFMGSLISPQAAEAFKQKRAQWVDQGAKVISTHSAAEEGSFVRPMVLDASGTDLADEELFGPLLTVKRVDTYAQAIDEANNTRFGLAASLLTADNALFDAFADQINAGVINLNKPTAGASSALPFGGVGLSGNHRPSGYYAADYCAYPVASLESDLAVQAIIGID